MSDESALQNIRNCPAKIDWLIIHWIAALAISCVVVWTDDWRELLLGR